jgi:hypothetical protein
MNLGYETGDKCNREGCLGIIKEREKETCSCHINPPCSACVEPRAYCESCGWDEKEEQLSKPVKNIPGSETYNFKPLQVKDLDKTKINWISLHHTHFSMIKKGVYPEGTKEKEVLELVKGTFGGRFTRFGNGEFEYIAYTD